MRNVWAYLALNFWPGMLRSRFVSDIFDEKQPDRQPKAAKSVANLHRHTMMLRHCNVHVTDLI